MEHIINMKREKAELINDMRELLDKAMNEKRGMNSREDSEYKRIDNRLAQLEKDLLAAEVDLDRRRSLAQKEIEMKTGVKSSGHNANPEREFRNVGEMLYSVARFKRDGIRDHRLDELYEKREQQMGTGSQGGYALPDQFDSTIRQVVAQEGVVRSRATILPAGQPPDARLTFPSLDQTSGKNNFGGVSLVHTGEGITMTETDLALREVSLEPKEISAYIVCTNKLLNNWQAAGTFISKTLSQAMVAQEDYDFLRGDGINKALGVINSAAAITYSRATPNLIDFPDIYGMMARMLMRGGSYIWLASQTVIPELASMTDAGTHAVWLGSQQSNMQGAQGPLPSTLMGLPIVFSDRLPALGTQGDLSLLNLSYYVIKDGSGPFVASSEHIYFLSNKTVFKIVWNVDGKSWLTEPLQLEGDSSTTVSPFVVLT